MLELIIIAIAGSVIAGLWDLKTTEVPDEIPAIMLALGIFVWYIRAAAFGQLHEFFLSLAVGTILLAFGLILYKKGQWGGADAWILAAIGYLIPVYNGTIFMVDYVPNFLLVSVAYMVIYAFALGVKDPKLFSYIIPEMKKRKAAVMGIPAVFLVFAFGLVYYTKTIVLAPLLNSFVVIVLLVFFWVYAKVIEQYAFRKKIPSSKLRPGDVLENMLWRGITAEEVMEARKKHKFVVIKEGVRFVPVFPITLVVTLLYGNLFLMIF